MMTIYRIFLKKFIYQRYYDALLPGDKPYVSKNPKTRHPRLSRKEFNVDNHIRRVVIDAWKDLPFPKGKIMDELDQYEQLQFSQCSVNEVEKSVQRQ